MAIQVGDTVPSVTLKRLGAGGLEDVNTADVLNSGKIVLFSLPGAYTPTCSSQHLPGYVEKATELRAKGIDHIVCLSVNDPWVMKSWGDAHATEGKITMLPDGNGEFTRALGLEVDMSIAGLGVRGKRFSMLLEDGVVKRIDIEPAKGVTVSGADACLINVG